MSNYLGEIRKAEQDVDSIVSSMIREALSDTGGF